MNHQRDATQEGQPAGETAVPCRHSLHQQAAELLRALGQASDSVRLEPLSGDASTRRYYRVRPLSADGPTYCLMEIPPPAAGAPADEEELPFLNIQRYLEARGVPAPRVFASDPRRGLVLLEDLGDLRLVDLLPSASPAALRAAYREAIDNLLEMQAPPPAAVRSRCRAFTYAFTEETFTAELRFFAEHMLARRQRSAAPSPPQSAAAEPAEAASPPALTAEFARLSRAVLAAPRVFTHRDYHSRNLMVHGGRQVIIDFQDARLGPPLYDLASLLFDAYWVLDAALRDELLAYYREGWRRRFQDDLCGADFHRQVRLTALQRNLKALGTFASMHARKQTRAYEAFIPPALAYARQHLEALPECATLRRLLAPWLSEGA